MSDSLIARLEEATEGSRDLDEQIALAIGIKHRSRRDGRGRSKGQEWFVDSHGGVETWANHAPYYTTSIDAALTLVPEGQSIELIVNARSGLSFAFVGSLDAGRGNRDVGATPALALCIAALKARDAQASRAS